MVFLYNFLGKKRTVTGLPLLVNWIQNYELTSGWYNNFESKIAFNYDICFIHR